MIGGEWTVISDDQDRIPLLPPDDFVFFLFLFDVIACTSKNEIHTYIHTYVCMYVCIHAYVYCVCDMNYIWSMHHVHAWEFPVSFTWLFQLNCHVFFSPSGNPAIAAQIVFLFICLFVGLRIQDETIF
jgi:ABC-type uncharacterized transport system permease subunit